MIEYDAFTFAGPTCSGTEWVRQTLKAAGQTPIRNLDNHVIGLVEGKPSITTIRRPEKWLPSFYARHYQRGWAWWNEDFELLSSLTDPKKVRDYSGGWEEFVERYINEAAGTVGRIFGAYSDSDYTIRCDHCVVDLRDALESIGVEHEPMAIGTVPVVRGPVQIEWQPDLLERFMEAEATELSTLRS